MRLEAGGRAAALVVGGGTMGRGIAEALVRSDVSVLVSEQSRNLADHARRALTASLQASGDADLVESVDFVVGLDESVDVQVAVEAVPEKVEIKTAVLSAMEKVIPPSALLATNTSSLSVTLLSRCLSTPERFIGMHFFNPVSRSLLIELVTGDRTATSTVAVASEWVARLGKERIVVRDSPGFATSRLGVAIGLEAIRMVEEGVASAKDIDRGMELGYRFPMGPLKLTDLVGLDVRLQIAEHLSATLGSRFAPPILLRQMVESGYLGRENGEGVLRMADVNCVSIHAVRGRR